MTEEETVPLLKKMLKFLVNLSISKEICIFFGILALIILFFRIINIDLVCTLSTLFLGKFPSKLTIFTSTCLTILALFTTCAYAYKISAEHNMRKAIADFHNFYFYINTKEDSTKKNNGDHSKEDIKDVVKVWVKELDTWRELSIKHTFVITNFLYSFLAIGIVFLVSIFFDINGNYCFSIRIIILLLLWLSIWKFIKGFGYPFLDVNKLSKSCITKKTSFLSYECKSKDYYEDFLDELKEKIEGMEGEEMKKLAETLGKIIYAKDDKIIEEA